MSLFSNQQLKELANKRNIASLLILGILVLAIPLGVRLVRYQQLVDIFAIEPAINFGPPNVEVRNGRLVALDATVGVTLTPPWSVSGDGDGGGPTPTPGNGGGPTPTPFGSGTPRPTPTPTGDGGGLGGTPRCEVLASCSGATCTFNSKFFINNVLQEPEKDSSKDYAITLSPNIDDKKITTGWNNYLSLNPKGTYTHTYSNVADGPYTAELNIGKKLDQAPFPGQNTQWYTSCRVRVLRAGGGGGGADIGYDCQRTCNGQIKAYVFKDQNKNGKKDSGEGVANGIPIRIEAITTRRGEVDITRKTEHEGRAYFDCIPAEGGNDDDGIRYKVTVQSIPSDYTATTPLSNSDRINLDSCNDTDEVYFGVWDPTP